MEPKGLPNRGALPAVMHGGVARPAPLVVFAVGNESRGDDALGPLLLRRLEPSLPTGARVVADFQLQVEHAMDLVDAELALFIDAACGLEGPFAFYEIGPGAAPCAFSHAISPQAVLEVYTRIEGRVPPPVFVLGVRASRFELGEPPGEQALADLDAAARFAETLLAAPDRSRWQALVFA